MNNKNSLFSRSKISFCSVLNVLLIVIVIMLSYQNYTLRTSGVFIDKPVILNAGDKVGEVELLDENGNNLKINFSNGNKDVLLCIISTNCPSCKENLNKWKSFASLNSNSYDVIFLNADKSSDVRFFMEENKWITKIFSIDETNMKLLKISAVPITYIISKNGEVLFSHLGKIREELKDL
ncbi:MAG: redoxin family protein [Ignavibacteria bacterium]|nr:redoxin family protein [Ignavibacteria bacterium]